jgi:hypothetical protein
MSYKQAQSGKQPEIHPIWRGIGCLLIILIPLLSYGIGSIVSNSGFLQNLFGVQLPPELTAPVNIPRIGVIQNLYLNLFLAVVISVILFAILTVLYSVVYRVAGPPKYGPLDAPPVKRRGRPRKSR